VDGATLALGASRRAPAVTVDPSSRERTIARTAQTVSAAAGFVYGSGPGSVPGLLLVGLAAILLTAAVFPRQLANGLARPDPVRNRISSALVDRRPYFVVVAGALVLGYLAAHI
jgi:hypothetical protein